jgi:threonyl-tRNA synthetase
LPYAIIAACCCPQTFWHSSAHVLGQVLELEFGVDLTIGPALEEGFYYDCYMGDKVRLLVHQSSSSSR